MGRRTQWLALLAEHGGNSRSSTAVAERLGGYGDAARDVEPNARPPRVDCARRTGLVEYAAEVDRGHDHDAFYRPRAGARHAEHFATRRSLRTAGEYHFFASGYKDDSGCKRAQYRQVTARP